LCVTGVFLAKNSYSQTSFGVKASVSRTKMIIEDAEGEKTKNKFTPLKYDFGVFAELPVTGSCFLRPELLYTTKGLNEVKIFRQSMGTTLNLTYLELPLFFLYKEKVSDGNLLLGLGPYIALGISGESIYGGSPMDIKFTNNVTVYDGRENIRPLDAGAKIMAGYEFKNGLSFSFNSSLGLTNIIPSYKGKTPDDKMRNLVVSISANYIIWK